MTRTLIIGDIHGCYDELRDLFDAVALADDDLVISVGDLVDRGPDPGAVIDWFLARPNAVVLMGNHERKHVRGVFSYSQEVTRVQLGDSYTARVDWMRGLPYFYETPEIRVVHAAMQPGVPLAEQDEAVLCGTVSGEAQLRAKLADRWWHEVYDDAVPVAFGHHVVTEPLVREGKIYGIDTGACHGGLLTALSVPDFRLYSVRARGDHWAATAARHQEAVLRTRPWPTMSWKKIDETLADLAADALPDAATSGTGYVASVAAWAAAIRALVPALHARVPVLADELRAAHGEAGYTAAATAHPAKSLLFMHARGRLGLDDIRTRCANPTATLDLAAKLGVDTSALASLP